MRSDRSKWLVVVALAVALGWLSTRGTGGPSFMRLPVGPMPAPAWTMPDLDGRAVASTNFAGKVVLLNFWATWCPPCVQELPELAQFQREFRAQGWQVLGLAVDSPTPVREFLKKLPLDFDIGMAGLTGTELARKLGNTQGGLPFSVAFGVDGEVIWRKLGSTNLEELRELAKGLA